MIPIVIIATAAVLFVVLERMLPQPWRRYVISSVSPPVLFALAITLLAPIATLSAGEVPLGHLQGDQELGVTDSDFAEFTKYYYETGSPDQAPKMLRYALSKNWSAGGAMQLQYFFARIAQLNPGTVRGYEALWSGNTHAGRLFILSVLRLAGDEQTRQFLTARAREEDSKSEWPAIGTALSAGIPVRLNVLDAAVRSPMDLDMLWAEFIVTGNKATVVRLINVLEWPDQVRRHIDEWLHSRAAADPVERKRAEEHLAFSLGISFDSTGAQLVDQEDLDTRLQLEGPSLNRKKFEAVRRSLPFTFSNDDVLYVSVKTAAVWSLASKASQHPLVLQVCEAEAAKRTGRSKLSLLEIAETYLSQQDYSTASKKIREYLAVNPFQREMRRKLRLAESELDLQALRNLSIHSVSKVSGDVSDPKKIALRCDEETEKTPAYISELTIRDRTQKELSSSPSYRFIPAHTIGDSAQDPSPWCGGQ